MPPDDRNSDRADRPHPDLTADAALLAATRDEALVAALCRWKRGFLTREDLRALECDVDALRRELATLRAEKIGPDRAENIAVTTFRRELRFWGGIAAGLVALALAILRYGDAVLAALKH
ncbi:MAG TPA: hypothetical protein ENK13_03110 [Thermopetrobacter sp.]|nr:hypothetical protein [Thermopetrobacter sp.]